MTCTAWCSVMVKKRSRFLDGIGAFLYGGKKCEE
ncbi:unknown [Ruminococcus sp. CAG:379]|nr:unknown [Ruminococcus sp. CAG:379]